MKFKSLIIVFLCLNFILPLLGQQPGEKSYKDISQMPTGKIGKRIMGIISTINSNNPDAIRSFITSACTPSFQKMAPMERHIRVIQGVYRQTGGLDFHSIRTYVPERAGQTVVILKDRHFDSWQAFVVRFENKKEFKISGLEFSSARTPSNVKASDLSENQWVDQVKGLFERLGQKGVFSGSLLLAKGDQILLSGATGEASKRFHVPNRVDTKFNLGSMNKMFTSVAVMQLAEKGKLSTQDPISKYLDESWLPKKMTDKIKVHHLLSHTSGLGSYFNDTYWKTSRMQFRKLSDYKPLVKDEKLAFEPGKRFRYSNTGMFLLGVVIEKASGMDYFDYIRKHIYQPAGMKNSDCYEMDYPVENLAIGYSPAPGNPYKWQNNLYKHVIMGGPAGGGFSTVLDLHRFARALVTGKLISKSSLKKLWTNYAGASYGYGFRVDKGVNGLVVGHGGGFSGINSNLDIFVDKGYVVAVMANVDRGASSLASRIAQLLSRVK